jgi:hypothetical protein
MIGFIVNDTATPARLAAYLDKLRDDDQLRALPVNDDGSLLLYVRGDVSVPEPASKAERDQRLAAAHVAIDRIFDDFIGQQHRPEIGGALKRIDTAMHRSDSLARVKELREPVRKLAGLHETRVIYQRQERSADVLPGADRIEGDFFGQGRVVDTDDLSTYGALAPALKAIRERGEHLTAARRQAIEQFGNVLIACAPLSAAPKSHLPE